MTGKRPRPHSSQGCLAPILTLRDHGALFAVSHSGGKDSQAMLILLRRFIPDEQIVVIHAHLPGMEWPGVREHIEATIGGLPLMVTQGRWKDGSPKTFDDYVRHRGRFPSPNQRWCTSELKRAPIERAIRHYVRESGHTKIVSCLGLRAEESTRRAKAVVFARNAANSLDPSRRTPEGRDWYDWLPIHGLTTEQVFATISGAGQEPHWAYVKAGVSRLSCVLCILQSLPDMRIGARHNPGVARRLARLERETDHTFRMPVAGKRRTIPELIRAAA